MRRRRRSFARRGRAGRVSHRRMRRAGRGSLRQRVGTRM